MSWISWERVGSTQLAIGDRVRWVIDPEYEDFVWYGTVDQFDDRGRDGIRVEVLWDRIGRKSYKRLATAKKLNPGYSDFDVQRKNGLDVVFDYLDRH